MYQVMVNGQVQFEGRRDEAIALFRWHYDIPFTLISADTYKAQHGTTKVWVCDSAGRLARRPLTQGSWKRWHPTDEEVSDMLAHFVEQPAPGTKFRLFNAGHFRIVWAGSGDYSVAESVGLAAHARYGLAMQSQYMVYATSARALVSLLTAYPASQIECAEYVVPPQSDYPPACEEDLQHYARGPWQSSRIRGNVISFPQLRGRARHYWGSYWISLQHMLERMKSAGYEVIPVNGPQGGRPMRWVVFDAR